MEGMASAMGCLVVLGLLVVVDAVRLAVIAGGARNSRLPGEKAVTAGLAAANGAMAL